MGNDNEENQEVLEKIKGILPALSSELQTNNERELFIRFGNKLWELRKKIYNLPRKTNIDQMNEDQKKLLWWVYNELKIQIPLKDSFGDLIGNNSLEYVFSYTLTEYTVYAFALANYEKGIDDVLEDNFNFKYHDALREGILVWGYQKIGKPKKARAVLERLEKINESWSLSRAFSDYLHYFEKGGVEDALRVLKKLETFIGKGGIDNRTLLTNYRILYNEYSQTPEVRLKLIEYAEKVMETGKWDSIDDPRKILKCLSVDAKGRDLPNGKSKK